MANGKRLIRANEAYEAVIDLSGQADTKSAYAAFWKAGKEIQKLPTVDAVEVVHGRWIRPTKINGRSFNIFHCSVCNGVPPGVDEKTKFCAHCGAKMVGDTNG